MQSTERASADATSTGNSNEKDLALHHTEEHDTQRSDEPKRIAVVENIALAEAIAKSNVRPWTKRMFQLYCFCFVATLNSCINGCE